MADVATTCIAANQQICGRTVSRMPNTALFKTEPKINRQISSAELESKYDTRMDDKTYYST